MGKYIAKNAKQELKKWICSKYPFEAKIPKL